MYLLYLLSHANQLVKQQLLQAGENHLAAGSKERNESGVKAMKRKSTKFIKTAPPQHRMRHMGIQAGGADFFFRRLPAYISVNKTFCAKFTSPASGDEKSLQHWQGGTG